MTITTDREHQRFEHLVLGRHRPVADMNGFCDDG